MSEYRDLQETAQKIQNVLHAHRLDLLRIGTAGQAREIKVPAPRGPPGYPDQPLGHEPLADIG